MALHRLCPLDAPQALLQLSDQQGGPICSRETLCPGY
jgi:hypothetical protein